MIPAIGVKSHENNRRNKKAKTKTEKNKEVTAKF